MSINDEYEWYNFPQAVINVLVDSFNYSVDDAQALVNEYKPGIKLLDKYAEPLVIARMIDNDHKNNVPATEYLEYMREMEQINQCVAENLKMPDHVKKETEFCIKCNYPKYKGENCRFC